MMGPTNSKVMQQFNINENSMNDENKSEIILNMEYENEELKNLL
jgi:hypothetical protein